MITASLDDIAAKLPVIEFKPLKKRTETYNQRMQSLRGGRQFLLRTSCVIDNENTIRISLYEYTERIGEVFLVGNRCAVFNDEHSITRAVKSLERKAGCKLYYVLLISTSGEYL